MFMLNYDYFLIYFHIYMKLGVDGVSEQVW